MVYFLPAWYNDLPGGAPFGATEAFMGGGTVQEFDDTVHQIRMFLSAGEKPVLLSLSYAPTLRHILHRQDIYPLPVRNAFDLIQGIKSVTPTVLSFRELIGVPGMEWVYDPYVVLGYLEDRLRVCVSFGEGGDLVCVDHYDEAYLVASSDYYDDRGFLSSTVFYEKSTPVLQRYFDEEGFVRMEHDLTDGKVTLSGPSALLFSTNKFPSLTDLLSEVLDKLTADLKEDDMLVIASSLRHNEIVLNAKHSADVVLSFFEDRYDLSDTDSLSKDLQKARLIVTDTSFSARKIKDTVSADIPVYDISPFDTRLALGMSQRAKTAKILLPVDTLEDPYFTRAVTQIYEYLAEHDRTELYAVTSDAEKKSALIEAFLRVRDETGLTTLNVEKENPDKDDAARQMEDFEQTVRVADDSRIHVRYYSSENDLIRMLTDIRLIVDVSDQPLLYLQIAGISAGIPQVNYRFTRYVEHKKDGYIIENIYHLKEALEYYLSTLANWNEALVYCIGLGKEYSGERIVERWKELVKQGG